MSWAGNMKFHATTYYSVIFEACAGYFVELITDSSTGINTSEFGKVNEPRLDFTNW